MVISEKARGKGIGRTLMQYITPKYAEQASIGCGFVLPDNRCSQRMMVKDTDKGSELVTQIQDLMKLLVAYRTGLIKEKQ